MIHMSGMVALMSRAFVLVLALWVCSLCTAAASSPSCPFTVSLINHLDESGNSLPEPQRAAAAGVIAVLPSLLAWQPASVGLPPFTDLVAGVIPMAEPLYIKGPVVKGFGRGSKVGSCAKCCNVY
jgi:hypothetical protein